MNIKKKKKIQLFLRFLKENNCYQPYRYYLCKDKSPQIFFNSGNLFIRGAFTWACTKQGHEYWHKKGRKWESLYANYLHR